MGLEHKGVHPPPGPHTMAPMNLARSLALVAFLVVLHQRGSVDAATATMGTDSIAIDAANRYTEVTTAVVFTFTMGTQGLAQGDKLHFKLPGFVMTGTAAPTDQGCGTSTFTQTSANSGEADATISFAVASANLAEDVTCTITTNAATLNTGSTTHTLNQNNWVATATMQGGHDMTPRAIAASPAITVPTFDGDSVVFTAPMKTNTAVTLAFKCQAPLQNNMAFGLKLPNWDVSGVGATGTAYAQAVESVSNCGTTTFVASGVSGTGEANAKITFKVVNSAAHDATTTACTLVTKPYMLKTSGTAVAADTGLMLYWGGDTTGEAVPTSTANNRFLYDDGLVIMNPIINTDTTMTYSFKTAQILAIATPDTLVFKLPNFVLSDDGAVTTTGCGTTTFTDAVTNSGTADATITLSAATADLAVDTACAIHFPSGMAKNPATAANSQDESSELANRKISPVYQAIATECTDCTVSQSTLHVGNPAGSTATMIRLSFGLNVPMQIGDQLMVALPGWSFTNLATGFMTAPTTQWCGSSTFTAYGVNGAQSHGGTSFVMLTLATASLFDFAAPNSTYACHVTLASSATSTATTPATAQAANLATRTMSAILAAGTNINGTAIAVSSATSAAASSNSTTSTCPYGATSTCATRITQSIVISSLTVAAYTGNLKSTYECSYAKMVSATWCTATTGAVSYLSGVQVTSSAAARRAATISFVMDVETSVMTAAAVQTAVASGVTAANLVTTMTAMNTATGWAVAVPAAADITVNTAAFTGAATSSAAVVIPSAIMVLLGSLISLFLN